MPGTFKDLAQRTGMTDAQLSRQLAALYLVGAITADPKRAPAPRSAVEASEWTSAFDSSSVSSAAGAGDDRQADIGEASGKTRPDA